jgi:hypothetical protein
MTEVDHDVDMRFIGLGILAKWITEVLPVPMEYWRCRLTYTSLNGKH